MTARNTFLLLAIATTFVLPSCSGGGGGGGDTPVTETGDMTASGTLTLTGPDTAIIGDTLTVGDVALLLGPQGVDTYFFLDEFSTISGFEYENGITGELVPGDVENMFVMNVIDGLESNGFTGISMSIKVMGVDFDYTCAPCAGLTIDPVARTIDFDNVQVTGQGNAIGDLVLDGMVGWQ